MRSPYEHELDSAGTICAPDCPACRWLAMTPEEKAADARELEAQARDRQERVDARLLRNLKIPK
jgi:hypothetical protein